MTKDNNEKNELIDVLHEPPGFTDADFDERYDGAGQTLDAQTRITPFVVTLQSKSPQVERRVGQGGILGAQAGMMFDTTSERLFQTGEDRTSGQPLPGFGFQFCGWQEKFVKFYPRKDDGTSDGFIGVLDPTDKEVVEAKRDPYGNGKPWTGFGKLLAFDENGRPAELIQTFTLFGFAVLDWEDISTISEAAIPFTSTKITYYKRFRNTSAGIKYPYANRPGFYVPAIFQQRWRINTMLKTKGSNSWWIPILTYWGEDARSSFISKRDIFFEAGRVFYDRWAEGQVTAAYEQAQDDHASTGTGDGDDVPF